MAMFESSNLIYTRVIDWCLLPIFVLITLFAICGCGAVMVVSTVNADWCYGEESTKFSGSSIQTNSPDGTVLNIMDELGFEQTDLVFRGVKYYVTVSPALVFNSRKCGNVVVGCHFSHTCFFLSLPAMHS